LAERNAASMTRMLAIASSIGNSSGVRAASRPLLRHQNKCSSVKADRKTAIAKSIAEFSR
jgi:hypothetical protein